MPGETLPQSGTAARPGPLGREQAGVPVPQGGTRKRAGYEEPRSRARTAIVAAIILLRLRDRGEDTGPDRELK